MIGFLTLQPLIFGRWNTVLNYGMDERGYYTRIDLRGEWLIMGEDIALDFNMPFVYQDKHFSFTDTKLGIKVRFLEDGFIYLNVVFPTGRFSSKNPAGELGFGRYIRRDSIFGLFWNTGGIFTASSDTQEFSFYNKVSQRRAYRHMYFEVLYHRGLTEVLGFGTSLRTDYAYSMNQLWTSIKGCFYISPFIELGGEVWLYKPRPEIFRLYILGNFFI